MIARGLLAALFVVGALTAPAGAAEVQDDCTTDYAGAALEASPLLETYDPPNPYPIAEVEPDGTIQVHPQNVVPYVTQGLVPGVQTLAGRTVSFVQAMPGLTLAYVDCVV